MYSPTRQKADWHAKPTGAHNIVHNAHAFSSKVFDIFVGSSLMRIALALNLCEVCVCVAFIAYLHCCEYDFKLANAFAFKCVSAINALRFSVGILFFWENCLIL